ncbi:MAG TPA: GNAT family N-acetyltransferase, partial [Limnochorda sp.]
TYPGLDGPRTVRPQELPQVVELVNQVFCLAAGKPPTMGEQFPQLFSPENADNLLIYTDGQQPVAHVGLWMGAIHLPGVCLPVAAMGSVCTSPAHRGRGLASRLVEEAWERCRSQGRPLLFISGDRSLYLRHGAHRAGSWRNLQVTRPAPSSRQVLRLPGLAVRQAQFPDDLAVIATLHQREPVRWHRTVEDWPILAEAAGFATIYGLRQEFWLVVAGEQPRACWVTARGAAFPGELWVLEAFGDRLALAASLPELLAATGTEKASLPQLAGDPLGPALEASGLPVTASPVEPLPGTVAVTDWSLFWRAMRPYWEERLPASWARARAWAEPAESGTRYVLQTEAGERWAVEGEAALLRALFGAGDQPVDDLVPAHHPLAAALPVPLPWPRGLNYI